MAITDMHNKNEAGDMEAINKFLIVVSDLDFADKTRSDMLLPYPLLKYKITNGFNRYRQNKIVASHIIDVESIFRPAMLIPCPDRSHNFGENFEKEAPRAAKQDHCTHYIRFWGIPYKFLDRAGNNLALPTAEGDPIFLNDDNINAIHNLAEQDSDDDDADDDN